jgi:hypothetical protein
MSKLATLFSIIGLTVLIGVAWAKDNALMFSSTNECAEIGIPETIVEKEYKEIPLSESKIVLQASKNGRLYEGNLVIYVNPTTRTYSLIVQFDNEISCVLGTGSNFAPATSSKMKT